MRNHGDVQQTWKQINSLASLSELRGYVSKTPADGPQSGVARSVGWKAFLLFHSPDHTQWKIRSQAFRQEYSSLRDRFLGRIEHSDEEDSLADPLNEADSPKPSRYSIRQDEQLRQEIDLDVERCMPENLYFRQPSTQDMLLDILFLWSKLNPDIGYRQGMHEVLAPILWVVERDAIDPMSIPNDYEANLPAMPDDIFDSQYLAHDTFAIFSSVMNRLKWSYAPQGYVELGVPSRNSKSLSLAEPPIVPWARTVIERDLASVDPELAHHLQVIDVPPQLFLMRWIRLLFGRELHFDSMVVLWDELFMQDKPLANLAFVCVAMILAIRWTLIGADYNTALPTLLKYQDQGGIPNPRDLAFDATFLQSHASPKSGQEVIYKYTKRAPRIVWDIPPSFPGQGVARGLAPLANSSARSHRKQNSNPFNRLESLFQDSARFVNEREQNWGVKKALRDRVDDVRRNVQDLQVNVGAPRNASYGTNEVPEENTSRLQQTIRDLQARNKTLSHTLEVAVEELWHHQGSFSGLLAAENERVQSLGVAIAKVQFCQVYLNDDTIPLPTDDLQPPETSAPVGIERQRSSSAYEGSPRASQPGLDAKSPTRASASGHDEDTTAGAPHSRFEEAFDSSKTGQSKETSKSMSRPKLEDSSFSYMLGQDESEREQSHQVDSFPRPLDSRRGRNTTFLFGDEAS